ncbi:MAG: hypothetical protein A2253_00215 [Deltaproteobacteria bacterium RIFOXYA2_FULL_55_11]|nr:MAG: hypothetical protein A2253_00215 [Deltaproteobacteria bacterium RIFOXYA2_FULL_55_11]
MFMPSDFKKKKLIFVSIAAAAAVNILRFNPAVSNFLDGVADSISYYLPFIPSWFSHGLLFMAISVVIYFILQTNLGTWVYSGWKQIEYLIMDFIRWVVAYRKPRITQPSTQSADTSGLASESKYPKPTHCSFCGKPIEELRKLIAGPGVSICDECVDLTVDILTENADNDPTKSHHEVNFRDIERCIEFPPEYHNSGVSILSYFATLIRQKYPETPVSVRIEQDGTVVRLVVRTPSGDLDTVERALDCYGQVVMGQAPIEALGLTPIGALELRNELRLAQVRIESQKELLQFQDKQIDKLLELVGHGLQRPPACVDVNVSPQMHMSIDQQFDLRVEFVQVAQLLRQLASELKNSERDREAIRILADEMGVLDEAIERTTPHKAECIGRLRDILSQMKRVEQTADETITTFDKAGAIIKRLIKHYNLLAPWFGLPPIPMVPGD